MTGEERRDTAQQLQLMLIREGVSLLAMAVMLAALHPRVQLWARQKAWQLRQRRGRAAARADAAVAELYRDLSAIEHSARNRGGCGCE